MEMMESLPPPLPEAGPAVTYRFGPYMLDTAQRRLLSGSEIRPLPEKVFQILLLLLEGGCRVVEKQVFLDRVWSGTAASNANLVQHMFMLRGMLGGHAGEQVYIVTVPGKGYRFALPIETKQGLSMKGSCERCGSPLPASAEAYICSYECTFCAVCRHACQARCPNCGGEQVQRPRRSSSTLDS
jgi:DNA-binding winged helix-turn-helix (wHTH) protein